MLARPTNGVSPVDAVLVDFVGVVLSAIDGPGSENRVLFFWRVREGVMRPLLTIVAPSSPRPVDWHIVLLRGLEMLSFLLLREAMPVVAVVISESCMGEAV